MRRTTWWAMVASATAACGGGGAATLDGATPDAAPDAAVTAMPDAPVADAAAPCAGGPDDDLDGDGYTPADGDCDDCRADVNPGAIEWRGIEPAVDDDCDGTVDELLAPCDADGQLDELDPVVAAQALEACQVAGAATGWGLIAAAWVNPDGSPPPDSEAYHLGHGVLPDFGRAAPRAGDRMLALSSGAARRPVDPGYVPLAGYDKGIIAAAPAGFPRASPACPDVISGAPHDAAALELTLRAPTNAHGVALDWRFYAYDWPAWVCSQYNDTFAILMAPAPAANPDGIVAVAATNETDFEACGCAAPPCMAGGQSFACPAGDVDLLGTPYGFVAGGDTSHAGMTWQRTEVPVVPGATFTLRIAIWDAADGVGDSFALIDNLAWLAEGPAAATTTGFAAPATCDGAAVDPGEACDGGPPPDLTCADLVGGAGDLACSPGCQPVVAGCGAP